MRKLYAILTAVFLLVFFLGCGDVKPPPIAQAEGGLSGVVAHTKSAERNVQRAIPHTMQPGKTYLIVASEEHSEVLKDAEQARRSLKDASDLIRAKDREIERQANKLGKWYVRIVLWIALWIKIIALSWLVLCVLVAVSGLCNPLKITYVAARFVARNLLLLDLWKWLRNRRRGAEDVGD